MKTSILNKPSNLAARIFSAVAGAVLLVSAIAWASWSYLTAFVIIALVCGWEYFRMAGWYQLVQIVSNLLLLIMIFFTGFSWAAFGYSEGFYLVIPLVYLSLVGTLFNKSGDGFRKLGVLGFFHLYLSAVFVLLSFIVFPEGTYQPGLLIGLLLCVWGLDSGAYFVGTYFGRHKLFPRISPKKTWEGLLGGIFLSLFGGWISYQFFPILTLGEWFVFALIVGLAGAAGDLLESMLKRSSAVKDSGNVIPGHGGFLDRFDSLLMSIPFIWAYVNFFVFA